MSYLNEAFKALSALNEDTFSMSDDGIKKLSEFEQNDDLLDDISVIDTEAETEDELQDSYVGKVILDCSVCHSKLYKDKEEVTLDEEQTLANVGEECPYCYTSDGFKVIGEVSAFGGETETNTDDDVTEDDVTEEDNDDIEDLEEGLFSKKVKQPYEVLPSQLKKGMTVVGPNGDKYKIKDVTRNGKDVNILHKDGSISTSDAFGKKFKVIAEDLEEGLFSKKVKQPYEVSYSGIKKGMTIQDDKGVKHKVKNVTSKDGKNFVVTTNNSTFSGGDGTGRKFTVLAEDYSEKYIIVARNDDNEAFYYDAENDHLTNNVKEATQYAEEWIAEDDLAMISKNCKNDFVKIELQKVPQLDLLNKDDNIEEAVGTLDRPMSKLDGTLGNVLTAHKDELSKVRGREDGLAFLDSIEPEVKNKGYLRKIKDQIAKIPEYKVPMLLYNLILKGDGMGTKIESVNESVNNVNVETDDATVSVSQDDNGTVTVQTTPKDDATTPMSDEAIVPVSDETQTEIENNTGDEEIETDEIDIPIDEFDEESFDELGESYLKRIYENVDSYRTTNITNYNDQIKVEGVIKFDSGNKKKTSFIFESKDCTKSGKLRFIGENVEITNGKKAFTIVGSLNEKKFITESFNYNYKTTDKDGTASRVYGTLRKGRASK